MNRFMVKAILLFAIFFIHAESALSQNGYIEIDSSYLEGQIKFNPKRPFQVSFLKGKSGPVEVYTADQLKGFGDFKGKSEYLSFTISYRGEQRAVFLKREAKVGVEVFSLADENRVFLFDGTLTELKKDTYREQIAQLITTCSPKDLGYLPFNKNAIITVLKYYENTGECYVQQNFEVGILSGYSTSTLNVDANSEFDFGAGGYEDVYNGVPFGAYVRIPYWPIRGIHWLIQTQFQNQVYQTSSSSSSRELDVSIVGSSLQISGAIYYEHGGGAVRPYIYGGPGFLNLYNVNSQMLLVIYNGETATFDDRNNWFGESVNTFGLTWGAGIRLAKLGQVSISAEYQGNIFSFPDDYKILSHNVQIKIGL